MPSLQELLAQQPQSGASPATRQELQRLLEQVTRTAPQMPREPWNFSRWSPVPAPRVYDVMGPAPSPWENSLPMVGVRPQSQVRLEELLAGPRSQPLPATAPPRPAPVNPVLAQGPMQGPPVPFERLPTGPADLNAMLQRSVEEGTADNARRAEANLARVAEARQQDTAALIAAGLSPEAAAAEAARVRPQGAPAQAPASAEAAPSSESGPTPPGTSSELPLPPPPTPPPGSGAGGTDPIETALRGLMAGGGGGGSRGGVPAASGNYPSLASIPRPDSNAILAQYDQARPQTQAANTDEMHMAGLLGALAGIQMRPGQRLGFGLQGAMAGGAEGYSNERQRQRQDLRMDEREQRQHAAGRASLQAQLEGQDYTRQTDVQRFDQANRFHQESQSTARAGIAASAANAAATRQMQGLGLMIRLQQLRQSGAVQNLDLDMGAAASMLAPRISGSAGASQRLALPGGLRLSYNGENNLGVSQVETAAGRRFDDMVKNSPELRLQTMSAGGAQLRTQFIQRQIEDSFMGTLGTLAQQAQTDPIAAQRLQEWQDFTRRQTIIARSHRQATGLVSGTGNLD